MRKVIAVAVLATVVVAVSVMPATAVPAAQLVCRLHDDRIDEASGIAQGIVSPDVFYVQNDSGDTNRFFALDARTCRTVATVTVPGARNVDWEDIAVAPDAAGTPSVWLADTGDNTGTRSEVTVYRVDEPRIRPGQSHTAVRSTRPQVWRLRYPPGPADAESLAVTPHGVGYIVTKSLLGASVVYRLPVHPDPERVQEATRVGDIQFAPLRSGGPADLARQVTATSAAFSPDGRRLAVRTYTDAYLWTVGDDADDAAVAAALRARPDRIALPAQPQGEGIAVLADRLLIDSEGRGSAVYSIALPPLRARSSASPSASRSSSSTPRAPASSAASTSGGTSGGGKGSWVTGLVVLIVVVVGAGAWWTLQLVGRARR